MKKRCFAAIIAVLMSSACGCSTMQAIDQWKCDNLGWCCFGVQPSNPCPYDGPVVGASESFYPTTESAMPVQGCPTCP